MLHKNGSDKVIKRSSLLRRGVKNGLRKFYGTFPRTLKLKWRMILNFDEKREEEHFFFMNISSKE
jgi:hypothetical protein